ncbi:hypothetical protein J7I44_10650 [Frateuria sp. MAH-13]|uniref:Uncharacterized protein n=1 Tax=Frateuria flava TaxID=2821489 RepID=A0ABS4DNW5_9GAMM|nr:hypothetical protein [Frateuria flava]MBP1474757.1 hypothetical protein [Frateuria flava]
MKPFWKQLLYLHGHALPTGLSWREDAPERGGRTVATGKPAPPMLRWREVLRAALVS